MTARLTLTVVILSLGLVLSAPAGAQQERLLLEYHRYSQELVPRDPTPRLRVFSSGRAELYFPRHKLRAGLYELQLTEQQMRELQQLLDQSALKTTDSVQLMESALSGQLAAQRKSGSLSYRSDAMVSQVRIDPQGRDQLLFMDNLKHYPERSSDSAELTQFRGLVDWLQSLQKHPSAVRISDARSLVK